MKFLDIKKELVTDFCGKCMKIMQDDTCKIYEKPSVWERRGGCPMQTDIMIEAVAVKKKINPIKKSKRRG
uniref:Uncharacterized protein n=1 Tax=viral metagenome TaxID=1070528 RepID=A0A6M3JLM3_9ZZZZ